MRKAFALDSPKRGTSAGAVERKMQLPPQRGAKPAQERNEIIGRGPPPAGRMPFMSDSFLNRRSVALPGRRNLTRLPTQNSEEPIYFVHRIFFSTLRFQEWETDL